MYNPSTPPPRGERPPSPNEMTDDPLIDAERPAPDHAHPAGGTSDHRHGQFVGGHPGHQLHDTYIPTDQERVESQLDYSLAGMDMYDLFERATELTQVAGIPLRQQLRSVDDLQQLVDAASVNLEAQNQFIRNRQNKGLNLPYGYHEFEPMRAAVVAEQLARGCTETLDQLARMDLLRHRMAAGLPTPGSIFVFKMGGDEAAGFDMPLPRYLRQMELQLRQIRHTAETLHNLYRANHKLRLQYQFFANKYNNEDRGFGNRKRKRDDDDAGAGGSSTDVY